MRALIALAIQFLVCNLSLVLSGPLNVPFYKPQPKYIHEDSTQLWYNVQDYGAKGDNSTDNTLPFTTALKAALSAGGGQVIAPPGMYRFKGSLTVPPGVTLKGSYNTVPSHDLRHKDLPADGTTFIPLGDRKNEHGTPFITINADASLAGVVIWYAEQETIQLPVPYPWTILMNGNNAALTDVELLGAWNGVNATGAHRHYIARIQGQPINIGVFIDATYDIGRIEDVHFNPWFSCNHPFIEYQLVHGRAFVMGRSDWEYVFNTFAFGYAIGYHFINTKTGQMNGNFLGIGMDLAINASVQVDASQAAGLLITNGEFTAFHKDSWLPKSTIESSQVVVGKANSGPVKFVDSSFWGPSSQIALLNGNGVVSFSSCEFVAWDEQKKDGRAAIRAMSGSLILQGNHFREKKKQVELSAGVKKAVIIGNIFEGPEKISIQSNTTITQIGFNAFDAS